MSIKEFGIYKIESGEFNKYDKGVVIKIFDNIVTVIPLINGIFEQSKIAMISKSRVLDHIRDITDIERENLGI